MKKYKSLISYFSKNLLLSALFNSIWYLVLLHELTNVKNPWIYLICLSLLSASLITMVFYTEEKNKLFLKNFS